MVSTDELLRIARRHDTLMSFALLRALGYEGRVRDRPRRRKRGKGERAARERATYAAMRWCFENHGSPMDRC